MKHFMFLILCLCVSNCDINDNNDKSECFGIACTEEFRTIIVNIKNSTGNPVALDSFKVTIIENGNDISRTLNDMEWQLSRQEGNYPLFGDEFANAYQNQTLGINFKGFIDDEEVISSNYTVGADCCHVILIAGDAMLVVD